MIPKRGETLVARHTTYALELDGKRYVIRHVPARAVQETGEQLFAPHTVERLQRIILRKVEPRESARTLVYEYSE